MEETNKRNNAQNKKNLKGIKKGNDPNICYTGRLTIW